eukprot:TRINITY_DN23106_c0_g1_i2.p2 TRINITY_DN23106_c0_g1~~TRINITY_DN23106_c0_g1_i2.p2  ORF type:complete len:104 (-),score=0.74 TRINITY_DN23106_c0_g1_i2:6-317(-)
MDIFHAQCPHGKACQVIFWDQQPLCFQADLVFIPDHACMAVINVSPVSYTHLTLPTICSVQISVVAGTLKKKKKTDKILSEHLRTTPTRLESWHHTLRRYKVQ